MATFNAVPAEDQGRRNKNHTSTVKLAELATKARPKLLIICHRSNLGGLGVANSDDELLAEVRKIYKDRVVLGRDLEVY